MEKYLETYLLLCLVCFSCSNSSYASESISKTEYKQSQITMDKSVVNDIVSFTNKRASSLSFSSNQIYSPLGDFTCSLVESKNATNLEQYKTIAALGNVEYDNFLLSCQAAFATTDEVSEDIQSSFEKNKVSFFKGSLDELNNSLSRFFDRDIKVENSGEYSLNNISLSDRFIIPIDETVDLTFKGTYNKDVSALQFIANGLYYSCDDYTSLCFSINKTDFKVLIPLSSSSDYASFIPSLLTELGEEKRARISLPSFSLKSSLDLSSVPGIFRQQDNVFSFDKYGVKGESFTINGPTASNPDYDIDYIVDKPFLFASYYCGLPLFIGSTFAL